jgi:DivIVA domain-containing protein
MVVPVLLSLLGLGAVIVALLQDPPLPPSGPSPPDWDPLPAPADISRARFPQAMAGYDPATVDVTLDAVAAAYADLLAVAPPEVVARARARAERRTGRPSTSALLPDEVAAERAARAAARSAAQRRRRAPRGATSVAAAPDAPTDAEALRVEAALGSIDTG